MTSSGVSPYTSIRLSVANSTCCTYEIKIGCAMTILWSVGVSPSRLYPKLNPALMTSATVVKQLYIGKLYFRSFFMSAHLLLIAPSSRALSK
jgi:hypothetical protein